MQSTLFHVPLRLAIGPWAVPLFGWGLLLVAWAIVGAAWLAVLARRHGPRAAVAAAGVPLGILGAMILWGLPAIAADSGIPVRGYGVMLLLAAAAGTWLSVVRGRAAGFDADTILSLGMEIFLWGLVGARIFFVAEYHEEFFADGLMAAIPRILNIAAGGLVVFGALPTAAVAAWWFARRRGLPLLKLADCIAPGLLVGLALGRVGCFLNGCCYGGPTDLPWGVRFPPQSPPWLDQAARGLLPPPTPAAGRPPWSLPVHPAQLYAAFDAALLAVVTGLFGGVARRDGEVFALALTLHPLSRILLEAIRVDEPPAFGTPLSISQLVSVVLLVLAAGLWWFIARQPPRDAV
jgi:phosphatidylglycerol:prolipoprotein diacylglycerol transferase